MSFWTRHQIFEKNSIVLVVGILLVIAIGGLIMAWNLWKTVTASEQEQAASQRLVAAE